MDTLYRNIIKGRENSKLLESLSLQNIEKFENFFDFLPIETMEIVVAYLNLRNFYSF